jgi:ribose-phosphate pyrophosphokinase
MGATRVESTEVEGRGPVDPERRLMLFAGRANPALAGAIAERLGLELSGITLKTFSSGEVYCRYDQAVLGADVFIVEPTCGNAEADVRVNESLMELLLMAEAARGAGAHRVIAVMPWYGYSRQDKRSELREPISASLVARLLETAGVDRLMTIDLHAGQVQGFFDGPVDHMTSMHLVADYFRGLAIEDLVVVAPDVGRARLNQKLAEEVGAGLALMTKSRPAHQQAEIGHVIGEIAGRTALIYDDIIDTAGTLCSAAETVLEHGAERVFAAATHPVLSGSAYERLAAAPFEQIVVTDTIPLRPGAPENIEVLSCASMLADSIRRISLDDSATDSIAGDDLVP